MRYLRSINNGMVFEWSERLAANPNVVEVTEQEAYPERFSPINLANYVSTVDLSVPEKAVTPPPEVAPELLAEASRPFGRGERLVQPKKKRDAQATSASDVVGLIGDI